MAYRSPFFLSHHEARLRGAAAMTIEGDGAHASFPKERLIDSSIDKLFRFNGTTGNNGVRIDRGVSPTEALTRLVIPAGHNVGAALVQVHEDDNSGFTSPTTLHSSVPGSGLIDLALSPAATEQYLRFRVVTAGTAWEFSELFWTLPRTPAVGPDPQYRDEQTPNLTETQLSSRNIYRLAKGDDLRAFEIQFNRITKAQLAVFDSVWSDTSQGLYPLYFGSPDDADAVVYCWIMDRIRREQDAPNPTGMGLHFRTRLELLEALA